MANSQSAPQTPYMNTPRAQQVRRVERRLNDDWQYIQPEEVSDYATISESFIAEHNRRGTQATTLDDKEKKAQRAFAANDPIYVTDTPRPVAVKKKKVSTPEKLLARTKASANNISIMMWGTTLWLSVQLPLALISLMMLGLTSAVQAAADAGGITSALFWLANTASSTLGALFGFDSSIMGMSENFFLATYLIVFALGMCMVFAAYLQYTLSLLHPLSGEMGGLKMGVFIFVIFGYSVPLLNIFPWILLWMAVVWKYPR